ncbi:MAG TPA: hypothetical protein PK939_07365 [Bacteroidales bacterium]|nr:hypothetical protein [Bacteroidales bacterium]HQQ13603.1 hypothetical protein [Bacteroidales bacterium]
MKKIILLLVISCLPTFCTQLSAQGGPPNPGDKPLFSTPPLGGGSAPVGSGSLLLLGLGIVYSIRKYYSVHDNSEIEE